jgi:valyl-tRNA synthetase
MVVGHCERCGTVIEPRLSVQWFVRTRPLAERALAAVDEGRTQIVPPRFEKVYRHWMENILDWAVGRQLWWGHRIPAWYCPDGHITVTDDASGPAACTECGRPADELRQETDIFDTWFSSALWPFSTLGWPEPTADLARFYPTTVMETGYDILFFWVARMMMMGLFCTEEVPFATVYLHGLVRSGQGLKMSKTKGNVVDPLDLVEEIGADALRLALILGTSPGNDQRLTNAKLEGARNFSNKLWNVARFVLRSAPDASPGEAEATLPEPTPSGTLPERWIRSRLAEVTARATQQLEALDLAGYASTLQDFAWSDYCDWFVELAKVDLRDGPPAVRTRAWLTLSEVLADLLRLLHPLMPFVTEAIWEPLSVARAAGPGDGRTDPSARADLLMTAPWPGPSVIRDPQAEADFGQVSELVRAVRKLRTDGRLPAVAWLPLEVVPGSEADHARLAAALPYIEALARVRPVRLHSPADTGPRPPLVATAPGVSAWFAEEPSAGAADARAQLERQLRDLDEGIVRLERLLGNPDFRGRAPTQVVAREEQRLAALHERRAQLAPHEKPQSGYSGATASEL